MENSYTTADWELVTAQPAGGAVEGGEIWRVKVPGGWIYRWSHSKLGEHICFRATTTYEDVLEGRYIPPLLDDRIDEEARRASGSEK